MPRSVPDQAGPLRRVRSRTGRELDVIDASSSGLLIEGSWRALPNTHLDVHLVTRHGRVLVRCRVVRASVCELTATLVRYRAGLAFDHPVDITESAVAAGGWRLAADSAEAKAPSSAAPA